MSRAGEIRRLIRDFGARSGVNLGGLGPGERARMVRAIREAKEALRAHKTPSRLARERADALGVGRRGTQGAAGIRRLFGALGEEARSDDSLSRGAKALEGVRLFGPLLRMSNLLRHSLASVGLLGASALSSIPFSLARSTGGNQDFAVDGAIKVAQFLLDSPFLGGKLREIVKEELQKTVAREVALATAEAAKADPTERLKKDTAAQRFAGEEARKFYPSTEEAELIRQRLARERAL